METFKHIFSRRLVNKADLAAMEARLAKLDAIEEREDYLRKQLHLSSENINSTKRDYRFIILGEDFSAEELAAAHAELAVSYEFEHGTLEGAQEAIKVAVMDGEVVLRFRVVRGVGSSGNVWNESIFPNVVHVSDVLAGRVDVKGNRTSTN